jgi:hypothetical protein
MMLPIMHQMPEVLLILPVIPAPGAELYLLLDIPAPGAELYLCWIFLHQVLEFLYLLLAVSAPVA